jgi:hypothetical protein
MSASASCQRLRPSNFNAKAPPPHIRIFASDDDAVKWINQEARQRGFLECALTRRDEDTAS